ncbi:MAG: ribosome biogenesis GTPase Der [Planctomycetota bacterium]|nr:ribosome biogenesis GTPase Der [Planctomycetota bacterium]
MIPKVVIVGRPNVGKSSLLNMLAIRRVSIVDPTAGVTRDRISTTIALQGDDRSQPPRYVDVIDTGGYGIEDSQNLTAQVEEQIAFGLAEADLVLFVIDAHDGVTPLDRVVSKLLHTTRNKDGAPVLLVANKVDDTQLEANMYEAMSLGFGEPIPVSASTARNRPGLVDAILARIDWDKIGGAAEKPDPGMLLAIVGKRNAGKSTLVNALAGEERVIVSEIEGTTRDSVDVRFESEGKVFTAIDTAGVRKTKSLSGDIEYYSHHRALRSIRRADVVLFLIDAAIPVSGVDKQLSSELQRHFKPTVLVVNKWDLAKEKATQEDYIKYLDQELQGLNFAPIVFATASAKEGQREAAAMALNLHAQASHRVGTGELNRVLEQILAEKAPTSGIGRKPKIYYATQLTTNPPTIFLSVNDPDMFDASYQRFLINRFRDTLPFAEVPIRLIIRGRQSGTDSATGAARGARGAEGGPPREKGKTRGRGKDKKMQPLPADIEDFEDVKGVPDEDALVAGEGIDLDDSFDEDFEEDDEEV